MTPVNIYSVVKKHMKSIIGSNNGELFRNGHGHWEYRAERYSAVVDARSGRLQSLIVEGQELLAQGEPAASGGLLYADGKPFTAALVPMNAYDTIGAWDGNFGVWWHFRPDGIKLEYAVNQAESPTLTFVLNPAVVGGVQGPGPLNHRWLTPHIANDGWAYGEAGVTLLSKLATPIAFQGLDLLAVNNWNGRQAPTVVYALPQGQRVGGEIHIGPAIPDSAAKATLTVKGPRWHLFSATGKLEFQTGVTLEAGEALVSEYSQSSSVLVARYRPPADEIGRRERPMRKKRHVQHLEKPAQRSEAGLNLDVAVVLSDYNTGRILAAPTQAVTFSPNSVRRAAACGAPGARHGASASPTEDGKVGPPLAARLAHGMAQAPAL